MQQSITPPLDDARRQADGRYKPVSVSFSVSCGNGPVKEPVNGLVRVVTERSRCTP